MSVIGNASAVGIPSTSSPRCTLTLIVEAITVDESVAAAATARPDPKREICSNRFVSALRSGLVEASVSDWVGDVALQAARAIETAATANTEARRDGVRRGRTNIANSLDHRCPFADVSSRAQRH